MQTTGKNLSFYFGTLGARRIAADFSAAHVTPDAGALLLMQIERKRGWIKALAGKSTLNRMELGTQEADRYKKIAFDESLMQDLFVEQFISRHAANPPAQITLDVDATDDPIHGGQEGKYFHGYYDGYCYLPLYIFSGSEPLCAKLRTADHDGYHGALDEIKRIVAKIRAAWPGVEFLVRGDSGFCRDELMLWCESQPNVFYVLGLSRNPRLEALAGLEMQGARVWSSLTGKPCRCYRETTYRTQDSWSATRRVVAKAEVTGDKDNPRFVVTNLPLRKHSCAALYEDVYCARGDMENRIKEQQLYLFADRTSAATLRANQLRLWFSTVAYAMLNDLRELGLQDTSMAQAQCSTIRARLLKIAAAVSVSVRRIAVEMSRNFPLRDVFAACYAKFSLLPAT
jgi:hypothetical protein